MKRFSLNTKRAGKVLALALTVSLVVPSVPGQSSAAALAGKAEAGSVQAAPKAIGTESFEDRTNFLGYADKNGKQIVFTTATESAVWDTVTSDGKKDGTTFGSIDNVPEGGKDNPTKEKFTVIPAISRNDEGAVGRALSLKDTVSVAKYPSAARNSYEEVQSAKKYFSGAQIANPFATKEERTKLFDESRFTFAKAVETATKVDVDINGDERFSSVNGHVSWSYTGMDNGAYQFAGWRNRYSAPDNGDVGVAISFWANVPFDEFNSKAYDTNFFEFSNTESLVYSSDDLAKVYISYLYDEAVKAETVDNTDSPFYIGEEFTATLVAVDSQCQADVAAFFGEDKYDEKMLNNEEYKFTALIKFGQFMKWNPKAAESKAAIQKKDKDGNPIEGQYKVYAPAGVTDKSKASGKEIVLQVGDENTTGSPLYYHLKWSDTVYSADAKDSNYNKFRGTDADTYKFHGNGVGGARVIEGATGQLYMGTEGENTVYYTRDNNSADWKTGIDINPKSSNKGSIQNGQANSNAGTYYKAVRDAAEDPDELWHYYTVVITDEWFQVYVDGEPADCDKAWNGDTFNMGSSMFKPDGTWVKNNQRTDFQKLSNDDWSGSIYGPIFGESVMEYITDENTKLYVGGKTRETAEGTLIDEMSFYDVKLSDAEAKEIYDAAKAAKDGYKPSPADPEDYDGEYKVEVPTAIATEEINSDFVAKAVTGKSLTFTTATEAAVYDTVSSDGKPMITTEKTEIWPGDVNKDEKMQTSDALAILKAVANLTQDADAYDAAWADVDGNEKVQTADALAVLRHVAKLPGAEIPKRVDEVVTKATFKSTDNVPEKDASSPDGLKWTNFNVTPTVTQDEERGAVLELKDQVTNKKYPSGAPNKYNEIQSAKTYSSGAEITNPFATAAVKSKLYDESRFTFANAKNTATEVDVFIQGDPAYDASWTYTGMDNGAYQFATERNRSSAPDNGDAGVTISFWAKVPYDDFNNAAAQTSFFEFANTESLIYSSDDLAKVYISSLYDQAKAAGTVDDPKSPFYIGEEFTGKLVDVSADCKADVAAFFGEDEYNEKMLNNEEYQFTALIKFGAYMKWNPKAAESKAAIQKKDADGNPIEGQYKVYAPAGVTSKSNAGGKEIVLQVGDENTTGSPLYYHLKWSDTIYSADAKDSNYAKFRGTDADAYKFHGSGVGGARVIEGATGQLYMGTGDNNVYYTRDNNAADYKNGYDINPKSSNKGTQQHGQANTYAGVNYDAISDKAAEEVWHYYTITITDEWFQVYIDGEACADTKAWNGNTFNLGSSMFKPDGTWVKNNQRTDFQKLVNDDWLNSLFGQLFGESVMEYITDENTKLYLGGKTQVTAAGTLIDSVAFYDVVLDDEQVEAEYDLRSAK